MILDDLENINKYLALHPRFEKAFDYLNTSKSNSQMVSTEMDMVGVSSPGNPRPH